MYVYIYVCIYFSPHTVNERGSLKVLDRSFKVLLRTLRFFGVL